MANAVSDIIINITANASKAIEGLNQVRTQVTNTVSGVRSGMTGMDSAMIKSGELTQTNMGAAANALGMFERQSGIHFRAGGNQITGFGGRITTFGKNLKANLTSAGRSVTNFGNNLKSKLGTEGAMAFAAAGTAALSFSKQCISSAMNAESSWARYGALVNSSGGNWQQQSAGVKKWAKDVSNSYGYAVSDTREASATLMQAGNSFDFVKNNMQSVAALAARTGTTQAEAANMITMALNGRANALRKATGLEIENYRAADGTIDKQRLMTDILNQNKGALEEHSNTTEAAVARMENAWGSFKTSIGTALLPVIQTIVPIIQAIANAFNNLPGPVKTVIAAFLLIGGAIGVIIGAIGLLAPGIVALGGMISSIAAAGGVIAWLGAQVTLVTTAFPALGAAFAFVGAHLLPIIAVVGAVVAALYLLYEAGRRLGWWSDLGGMFSKFGETLSWVGGQIMGFIGWLGLLVTDFPAAMSQLQNFINNIGPAVASFLGQVGSLLGEMGNIIVEAFSGLGQMIADRIGGGDLTTGILRLVAPIPMIIYNALAYIAPMVLPALQSLGAAIVSGLGSALSGVGDAVAGALGGIGERVSEVFNGIRSIITGALQGDLGSVMDGIVDLFGPTFGGAIADALANLHTYVMTGLSNAFNDIPGTIGRILDATPVGVIVSSLGSKLSSAFQQLPTMITGALSGIGGAVAGALGNLGNSVDGGGIASGIRAMLTPIPTLVQMLLARIGPAARQTLSTAWTGIVASFRQLGTRILATMLTIPTRIGMAFMRIVTVIRLRINQARAIAGTLMTNLRNRIVTAIMSIPARVGQIFALFVQIIRTRLTRAWAAAGQLAGQIRQAVVDKISEMYQGAQQWFNNLASNIASWLSTAAANTLSGAQQIYDNIINKVKDIPQKVADEFGKIPGKISSALSSAAAAAASGAAAIVSAFKSALGIASPGYAQRMTEAEFKTIPGHIETSGIRAADMAYKQGSNIVSNWRRGLPSLTADLGVGTSGNLQNMANTPIRRPTVTNSTVRNEDNTRHITIENVTLDCNNLTQAQSRRILYNALQGL